MRICAIVKYPPIQGGVSAYSYWMCHALAALGHQVYVVTNADEVEPEYRIWMRPGDDARLRARFDNGGLVHVRSTTAWNEAEHRYIPAGNPSVTKLAAMATETVREHGCDVVFAFYLEPYGVAANLVSAWTGTPFVLRHAGSDRYALMSHPDLSLAYKELLRSADALVSSGGDFDGLLVPDDRVRTPPALPITTAFAPSAPAMDLAAVIGELTAAGHPGLFARASFDDTAPVIGMYGKMGELKGTLDLVAALGILRDRGSDAQLVLMGGGVHWPRVKDAILAAGLGDRVWRLPFLAPWQVPGFVRRCDAVCFLERGFAIPQHGPRVAAEILACGRPLVVSGEIVAKQPFRDRMVDGENHFLVPDPRDHVKLADVLAGVLADRAAAVAVGLAGARLVERPAEAQIATGYERALAFSSVEGSEEKVGVEAVLTLLHKRCPATAAFLGPRVGAVIAEHCGDVDPAHRTPAMLAYAVTAWCAAACEAEHPLRRDAIRLEHHLLWFTTDVEGVAGLPVFPAAVIAARTGVTDQVRPVATRYRRFDHLDVDPHHYTAGLADRGSSAPAPRPLDQRRLFLFHKLPQLEGRVYRIGEQTARILDLCTGELSVREIGDRAGISVKARDDLRDMVDGWRRRGLVAFAQGRRP
ncbi:glycosyltransferase [Kutzneria kofuensis]|uniref:Glycosyltransferase involved in cell wall biosynthesis n=1 Tax=Kutzneria kofuensis TaxID=103725 RepID=A0A7W9NKU6_9PSEU|nr:glycosyltransferase [Kutzneria kofuensis]MBB5896079.1 glycosyltransferase involved in cell wall biosynthesis [Kutzneria kofuensis]